MTEHQPMTFREPEPVWSVTAVATAMLRGRNGDDAARRLRHALECARFSLYEGDIADDRTLAPFEPETGTPEDPCPHVLGGWPPGNTDPGGEAAR